MDPGRRLGAVLPAVADACGVARDTPVYTTASHDTASAVAAVPAEGRAHGRFHDLPVECVEEAHRLWVDSTRDIAAVPPEDRGNLVPGELAAVSPHREQERLVG